jgi:hypothetical protein
VYFLISIAVLFVISIFWLNHNEQDKEQEKKHMENLLIHEPIEINQIDSIRLFVPGEDSKKLSKDEYSKVIEWFNQYEPNRISRADAPRSPQASLLVETKKGETIINYKAGKVYVTRSDVSYSNIAVRYVFIDHAPKLENFFMEQIN